jgi:hypothetical protein
MLVDVANDNRKGIRMENSSRAARRLLWLSFPPFIAFGLLGVAAPRWLAGFVDISLDSSTALADFRAIYGGVPFGVGVFVLAGLYRERWLQPAIALDGMCVAAAGLSRIYSSIVSATPSPIILLFAGVELYVAALAVQICRGIAVAARECPSRNASMNEELQPMKSVDQASGR